MRPPRFGTGTLMLLVAASALAAALVAQHFRAARREFDLRSELVRLTPSPEWGGDGKLALVGDRLAIAFDPKVYRRHPGARFRWRFELVDPSTGVAALGHRDDREVEVPAGLPYSPCYLEVIDRPPPGEYLARFVLTLYDPEDAPPRWRDLPVHEERFVVAPLPQQPAVTAGEEP